jgi:hypothetical protein
MCDFMESSVNCYHSVSEYRSLSKVSREYERIVIKVYKSQFNLT